MVEGGRPFMVLMGILQGILFALHLIQFKVKYGMLKGYFKVLMHQDGIRLRLYL
jgi:hypothetical protein